MKVCAFLGSKNKKISKYGTNTLKKQPENGDFNSLHLHAVYIRHV